MPTKEDVLKALSTVQEPELHKDIVTLNMVQNLKVEPPSNYGVKIMSMGFLMDPDSPVIWRGPMLHGAINQFFKDVLWGELDYLIVDMPPGTGDVQLTLCQSVPLAGAVIVTTP